MKVNLKKVSLEQIDKMNKEELIYLYRKLLASEPPRSITTIKRILTYKIQEIQQGKLKSKYQKILDEFAINPNVITERKETPNYQIQQGQKITKEYHGRTYEVIKTEDGFIYSNKHYKSLSMIAFRITGQKWSGPRFFNLRSRSNPRKLSINK
jgi:hypothetical protein